MPTTEDTKRARRVSNPRTERVVLSVTPETKQALVECAAESGMSMSTLTNTIILAYLRERRSTEA